MQLDQHIMGCILGTATGDAIGLPRERLGRKRARRLFGPSPLEHSLVCGRGLCSDDTEHTLMLAQALMEAGVDADRLAVALARRLRWWLIRIPAGVGFGTLRACVKLWLGFSPARSGVNSAGNGPAMRSAILGLATADRLAMSRLVTTITRLTHTDPRAEQGARVVATAAWLIRHESGMNSETVAANLVEVAEDDELRSSLNAVVHALRRDEEATEYADSLWLSAGVTGFANHTVPAAVYCWLRHRGDFRAAVEAAVELGGDTDTVGAITGALAGAELGPDAIPNTWLDRLIEWPCTIEWMRALASRLTICLETNTRQYERLPAAGILIRNVLFTIIVLTHGIRRLLPPY